MSTGASGPVSIEALSKIFDASTDQEFFASMEAITRDMGFERFLVGTQWFDDNGAPVYKIASGYPGGWQRLYAERQYAGLDPTVQHCRTSTDVVVWSEDFFAQSGTLDFFEEARGHGLGYGLSLPVHEARGVKSMISLARDKPIQDPREEAQMLAFGKVLASCAHFAHRGLIASEAALGAKPQISAQESQCLHWVALGKTSAEIGQIMSIAEPTVVFHVKNVMEKLDVKNRSQAIAVAFRLGLLM
ncbi:LuxR family transcriptional regulator [Acidovorax sp. sic0104]|uniref:LuxR family transcriptional regulator n=1 Tax=Acidovorax sp. sic0104 TaxID=2854784 RepID=UPI001C46A1C1|nr:LuxR family transcriptional regulator [Acidovorax sp. sic0104]MBV7540367.1 LuxR family transcriptional regulator [Acidovorax sp. sic0104]